MRCLGCYYVLDHLAGRRCPECGRPFDPADPSTYTTKPPFVWWRYWLPAFVLASGLGLVTCLLLVGGAGFGWAVTFAAPIMVGGVIGYSVRVGRWAAIAVAVLAWVACVAGMATGGMAGVFCTLLLVGMAIIPLSLSVLAGVLLRLRLKHSNWGQRQWLPILAMCLLPFMVAAVELRLPAPPAVAVETTCIIDAPLESAWSAVMFYEDVEHDPPLLLRLALRTPLYAHGRVSRVGDRRTCVYTRGRLTKKITAVRPLEALDFAVVEQEMFEDYSVRLTGGSFRFEAVDAGRTRVTLTTSYEPLLRPRWAWRPAETHVVTLLHAHVLEGMAQEAERAEAAAWRVAAGAAKERAR